MTDNGSAYRSKLFAAALRNAGARHGPTRPRTNGKAERLIAASLCEWARARPHASSGQRTTAIKLSADSHNVSRLHSGINGLTPWQRVNNLLENDR